VRRQNALANIEANIRAIFADRIEQGNIAFQELTVMPAARIATRAVVFSESRSSQKSSGIPSKWGAFFFRFARTATRNFFTLVSFMSIKESDSVCIINQSHK
jgi:hypothetical protein